MSICFPSSSVISELKKSKKLNHCLDLFCNYLTHSEDRSSITDFCKRYVQCRDKDICAHTTLRKTVFSLIYEKSVLHDTSVETWYDIVSTYGPTNYGQTVELLNTAPRNIPLKMGRLLLTKAELGAKPLNLTQFEQVVTVLFSSHVIARGVITDDFKSKLKNLRKPESSVLDMLVPIYDSSSDIWSLNQIFPHIMPAVGYQLLTRSKLSLDELSMNLLDNPNFADSILTSGSANNNRPKKFVTLDDKERERRENEVREFNRKNFKYNFDDDDVLDDLEEAPEQKLSAADEKLKALETILWSAWAANKNAFDRSQRKTKERNNLKQKLDWTDEQIEGWARMVGSQTKHNYNLPGHVKEVETYAPK